MTVENVLDIGMGGWIGLEDGYGYIFSNLALQGTDVEGSLQTKLRYRTGKNDIDMSHN